MRRSLILAVGTVTAVSLLAGCGSDKADTASPPVTTPAVTASSDPGTAATGTPIKIGTLGSYTGPQASSLGAMDDTMQAWVKWTNAHGGVNGHPVVLTLYDDANDPAKAKSFAQKLVADKVVAFVGIGSIVTSAFAKVVNDAGIPVIGSSDFQAEFASDPMFFAAGAQVPAMVYGALAEAKKAGVTKVGILPCVEAEACEQFANLFKAIGTVVGIDASYTQKISVSQPNYQAVCLAAKNAKVDGLVVLENAATVLKVADGCAQQGYTPKQINTACTAGSVWEGQKSMEGTVSTHSNAVPVADQLSGIKDFNAALDQYAPGVRTGAPYNVCDSEAWSGAEVFKTAWENADLAATASSAELMRALYTMKAETVGGLTPPLTYAETPKAAPAFVTCWFTQTITDGKFTAANNGDSQCIPDADVPKLVAAITPK
jgi:branched-chain amino acid transport system substrate-binding protein